MLSKNRKFIFCHIRKTGGNAIQLALADYCEDHLVPHGDSGGEQFHVRNAEFPDLAKHSPLRDYRDAVGERAFPEYFKFACIRNPWDRLMSWWFHFEYGTRRNPETRGRWMFRRARKPAFDKDKFKRFLEWNREAPDGNRCSMTEMLSVEGRIATDALIRYESLSEDIEEVCKFLDIPARRLAKVNSGRVEKYAEFYDRELVALVQDICRDDVDNFHYEFRG